MKLHQQLEQVLKIRVNSNDEIISSIKKLSELGKFDEPKKIAMLAIVLDRLGKLEDEALVEQSVKEANTNTTIESLLDDTITKTPGFETANHTTAENQTPPSAFGDVPASTEQPKMTPEAGLPEEKDTPTVSVFTPETITDPQIT